MLNTKCFSKPGMEVAVPEGDSSTGPKKSRLSKDEPPLASERWRKRDRFGKREEKGYGQREKRKAMTKTNTFISK